MRSLTYLLVLAPLVGSHYCRDLPGFETCLLLDRYHGFVKSSAFHRIILDYQWLLILPILAMMTLRVF